jgi:hypothetical protein
MLMKLGSFVMGGDIVLGGLLVSTIAFIAALAVLWRLLNHDVGPEVANSSIQYLVFFPTAFFFLAPFT